MATPYPIRALNVAAWAWRGAVALALRPAVWVPFLLIAAVQLVALMLMVQFHQPALLPLGLPLVRLLGGEQATHYPSLYYALPVMFFRIDLVVSVFLASIATGAATLLFAAGFGAVEQPRPWSRALRCAPRLLPIAVFTTGLLLGVSLLASLVPERLIQHNAAIRWGTRGATLLLFIFVQGLLINTTPWVILMGHGVWTAIRDSMRVAMRTFFPVMLAVGLPAVMMFPFSYASSRVDFLVGKFRPEIVAGLLGVQIVVQCLLTFLMVGAITRLFLWRTETAR